MNLDPLAENYPSLNPYNYCANNPLNFFYTNGKTVFSGTTVLSELSVAKLTYLSLGVIGYTAIMANFDGIAKKSTERVEWINENVMNHILETFGDLKKYIIEFIDNFA